MFFTPAGIVEWLTHYGYVAVIPGVMLEGPIVTVISGSLCSLGVFNLFFTYFVIVAADLSADCLYYAIGRLGNGKFLDRYGRYIGIDTKQALYLKNHFDAHGGKTLFVGKISHGIGGIFLVSAGLAKMPFLKFVWYNFLATLVKSMAFLLIGYFFGHAILKINSFLEFFASISAFIVIVAIVIYFYYYFKRKTDGE